ncbi:alpha/beta hydrolase [Pokkaliibacter plantistimulans]|nr:alpha/beta hydrolase [Pokkaliibacter plantistimulans]
MNGVKPRTHRRTISRFMLAMLLLAPTLLPQWSHAGPLRELWQARRQAQSEEQEARGGASKGQVLENVAYGSSDQERLDIYLPHQPHQAPLIVMVHGGGWRGGDKDSRSVVVNKIERWVPRGLIFVTVNYPMLPDTSVLQQANYVARALAYVEQHAAQWGGDSQQIVLMGHSAGAHLSALIGADPGRFASLGLKPWLGTVLLDSAAMDVESIMSSRHLRLYDDAFGNDPGYWHEVSPILYLGHQAAPFLAVCSSRRQTSCEEAERFASKAQQLQVSSSVLREDLSHRDINLQLGTEGDYTRTVERFMSGLSAGLAAALKVKS